MDSLPCHKKVGVRKDNKTGMRVRDTTRPTPQMPSPGGYNTLVPIPFTPVDSTHFMALAPLLAPLESHLAVFSLLSGDSTGQVYAAPPQAPRLVLAQVGHRLHLAGRLAPAYLDAAARLLAEELLAPRPGSESSYILHTAPPEWIPALQSALERLKPFCDERTILEHTAPDSAPPASFPPGYSLHEVTPALLADPQLEGLDVLADEMCSERESLEAFYAHSFGLCLFHENRLAAFCLSEYNLDERCEIGIATLPDYQRQGLATQLTLAFLRFAAARGIRRVGWDSWSFNEASVATALKAGFSIRQRQTVLYGFHDPVLHHAVGGSQRLRQNDYAQALDWYAQAFASGVPPAWAYWNAAVCHAHLDQPDAALARLREAARHGFDDPQVYRASPHFTHLHAAPGWQALLAELEAAHGAGKQV